MIRANDISVRDARSRASRIREGIHSYLATLSLIADAWANDDWQTLGYDDWDAYVDAEFGEDRLRLPTEHRRKAVEELRLVGMSQRAIAAAVGAGQSTVRDDLALLSGTTQQDLREPAEGAVLPTRVKDAKGKTYASTKPKAPLAPEPESPLAAVVEPEVGPQPEVSPIPVPERDLKVEAPAVTPMKQAAVRKEVQRSLVDRLAESAPEVQAADFMKRFSAALLAAGEVYRFPAERVGKFAGPDDIASLERHAALLIAYVAEVQSYRPTHLRLVSGGA